MEVVSPPPKKKNRFSAERRSSLKQCEPEHRFESRIDAALQKEQSSSKLILKRTLWVRTSLKTQSKAILSTDVSLFRLATFEWRLQSCQQNSFLWAMMWLWLHKTLSLLAVVPIEYTSNILLFNRPCSLASPKSRKLDVSAKRLISYLLIPYIYSSSSGSITDSTKDASTPSSPEMILIFRL